MHTRSFIRLSSQGELGTRGTTARGSRWSFTCTHTRVRGVRGLQLGASLGLGCGISIIEGKDVRIQAEQERGLASFADYGSRRYEVGGTCRVVRDAWQRVCASCDMPCEHGRMRTHRAGLLDREVVRRGTGDEMRPGIRRRVSERRWGVGTMDGLDLCEPPRDRGRALRMLWEQVRVCARVCAVGRLRSVGRGITAVRRGVRYLQQSIDAICCGLAGWTR
ncbi:hypothetical protein C8Q74DRAFT_1229664, partial [Fomes fomentarius]